MTFVVELRDLKKSLPRPVAHFGRQALATLCALRVRLVFLSLLGCALDCPRNADITASSGVLALLCGVLTAAASATLGLFCDAGSELSALFGDHTSPVFGFGQRFGLHFTEPLSSFGICPAAAPFPMLSGHSLCALGACALLLFGCGYRRQEAAQRSGGR
jgi:hypothetical protein